VVERAAAAAAGTRWNLVDCAIDVIRRTDVIRDVINHLQFFSRHIALVRLHRFELNLDEQTSVGVQTVPDRVPLERQVGQAEHSSQPVLCYLGAVVTDLRLVQRRHQHLDSFTMTKNSAKLQCVARLAIVTLPSRLVNESLCLNIGLDTTFDWEVLSL